MAKAQNKLRKTIVFSKKNEEIFNLLSDMQNRNENISEYICQLIRKDQEGITSDLSDIKIDLEEIKKLLKNQKVIVQSNDDEVEEDQENLVEVVEKDETPAVLDEDFLSQFQ